MAGLIIATHSDLSFALLKATEMILGPVEGAQPITISRSDDLETLRHRMLLLMDEVDPQGQGIVIMTDMFGGTPSNISFALMEDQPQRIEVLSGVNLPMVVKFFSSREGLTLKELTGVLQAYGQQGIARASDYLGGGQNQQGG